MLAFIVQHKAHRPLAYFRGKLVRCFAHRAPSYSGVGASGKPGAVQIDTPEIRNAKCPKEKLLGKQAKLRLAELLREDVKIEDSGERDRWKRPLVWVRLPSGKTAGEILMADGYAVRWQPGYRSAWCE
ncbi:thermonuclease family protein [Nitratireductor rhodophyticola]|uniref:thermonuclease family protein n=1 Tax=Nitratireductor rhodophyticola TaxID=2854036 RepID=UPI003009FFE8